MRVPFTHAMYFPEHAPIGAVAPVMHCGCKQAMRKWNIIPDLVLCRGLGRTLPADRANRVRHETSHDVRAIVAMSVRRVVDQRGGAGLLGERAGLQASNWRDPQVRGMPGNGRRWESRWIARSSRRADPCSPRSPTRSRDSPPSSHPTRAPTPRTATSASCCNRPRRQLQTFPPCSASGGLCALLHRRWHGLHGQSLTGLDILLIVAVREVHIEVQGTRAVLLCRDAVPTCPVPRCTATAGWVQPVAERRAVRGGGGGLFVRKGRAWNRRVVILGNSTDKPGRFNCRGETRKALARSLLK
jgi:hypothetical protein